MSEERVFVPKVVLRLSEETANTLWELIFMHGEHVAAGAPVVNMGRDKEERMNKVFKSIDRQLGRPTLYGTPAPDPDAVL